MIEESGLDTKYYDIDTRNLDYDMLSDGYLIKKSQGFDVGVISMNQALEKTLSELTRDPSNPVLLARYQSLLSEYTLYRNLQSNVIKTLKDVDNNIISNFR